MPIHHLWFAFFKHERIWDNLETKQTSHETLHNIITPPPMLSDLNMERYCIVNNVPVPQAKTKYLKTCQIVCCPTDAHLSLWEV